MKKQSILAVTALLLLLMVACKKSKKSDEPVVAQKTYIKKQVYSTGIYTWNYDANNQLSTIEFTSANEAVNGSSIYRVNSTNNKGAITEAVYDAVSPTAIDYKYEYTYNTDGNLTRFSYANNATGMVMGYTNIEYLANNNIKYTTYNASNAITQSSLYILSADGKNVIEMRHYSATGELSATYLYTNFDTKKTQSILYPKGYSTSPNSENNFQTQSYTLSNNAIPISSTYTFEYNADGYRTKRTTSTGAIETTEYFKK